MRILVLFGLIATTVFFLGKRFAGPDRDAAVEIAGMKWHRYSEAAFDEARRSGRGVLVFATAEW